MYEVMKVRLRMIDIFLDILYVLNELFIKSIKGFV